MAAKFICDGCGKEAPAEYYPHDFGWHKPRDWFQREDSDGVQDACCRECIKKIAEKSGKTSLVIPL